MREMKTKFLLRALLPFMVGCCLAASAEPIKVRVKDVTRIKGVESHTLVGYGLIVGLAGTGDSDEELTQSTIANLLQNFNIIVPSDSIKAKNTAAVMVTAAIDKSANEGDAFSVTVSSLGDARSLTGGSLLLTPLLGPDGKSWAVAQGAVTTGSYLFGGAAKGGETQGKNHPTVGVVSNGAKLLRDIGTDLKSSESLTLCLTDPDFTSAVNLAEAINKRFFGSAIAVDAATVRVRLPEDVRRENGRTEFIRDIEQLAFTPDQSARVVFCERTGTIVIGSQVKISSVAVSHGSITISIKDTVEVSQPAPFRSGGTTVTVNDQQTSVTEERAQLQVLPATNTVGELVQLLNALGVTPRDIMVIFTVLREAGALHAALESI